MEVQQQPLEEQLQKEEGDDEFELDEQGLIARKRNPFSTNNSIDEPKQPGEDQVVKDFIQQNGLKIDQNEKEKNKQEISEYCVYYDTDKGIWKCRICSWDCEDVKTVGQHRSCFFRETKGTELHHESSTNGIDSNAHEKNNLQENTNVVEKIHNQENGNGLNPAISNQNGEHQKHDDFSSEISLDKSSPLNKKIESSDIEVIKDDENENENENEITEYDVETVIKKQDTHDLYCPNCNSCITKRVILRKRKRRIPAPGEDAKRNKSDTPISSQLNVVQPAESNEYDHQREPDVFRCLSCFSIFMPTGTGFKLFRMFGNKSNEENNLRSEKEVVVKKHWFSSIFASDKVDQSNNKGSIESLDRENNISSNLDELNGVRQEGSSRTTNATMAADRIQSSSLHDLPNGQILVKDQVQSAPSSTQESVTIEQVIAEETNSTSTGMIADTRDQLLTTYQIDSNAKSDYPGMFVVMPPANNNVEPTENDISSLQHDGLRLVVPPNVGSLIIENSYMNHQLDVTVQMNSQVSNVALNTNGWNLDCLKRSSCSMDFSSDDKEGANLSFPPSDSMIGASNLVDQMKDLQVSTNLTSNGKELTMEKDNVESTYKIPEEQRTVQNNVEIHLDEPLKDVLTDKQIKLVENLKNNESIKVSIEKDTIITIDNKQLDASSYQRSPETTALQHVESVSQQGDAATLTGGGGLEIVKSMVYGGLMESIVSLSVVSSAAGANAATINVLALGLANIFGGLFVIIHDLWDLKAERAQRSSEDRYQQLLGRRENFTLHMVVCLLSYLVFGFLPPIMYGFSFRESNNRDLKLVIMASVSVICIMILAAGKAYVQNKSYFKTMAYYVTFGFMVSGASYVFGDLIMKLLEKIEIFHSGSGVNLVSIHGMNSKPALATY